MNQTISDLQQLLTRYQTFARTQRQMDHQLFQSEFDRLKKEFAPLLLAKHEQIRQQAPSFNLFEILDVERREVKTHSALLAHWFDPTNTHGQQHLFLNSFLKMCQARYATFPLPTTHVESSRWIVQRERATPYGQLDVVVQSADAGFQFVIENKIDAGEQPAQLRRYADWLATQSGTYPQQALIYLTPDGDESISHGGASYYTLSWQYDIANWLTATLPFIIAPNVTVTLQQYIQVIKNL